MNDTSKLLWLGVTGLLLWLLYELAPVLTPFFTALLLAYLFDPLVDKLQARKLPRTAGVVIVFIGLGLVLLIFMLVLIPVLQKQVSLLIAKLPAVLDWLQGWLVPKLVSLGLDPALLNLDAIRDIVSGHWQQLGGALSGVLTRLSQSGGTLFTWAAYVLLIPVVLFYLLRDWDELVRQLHQLLPPRMEPVAVQLARECDQVLSELLRGQLLVMLGLATIYIVGLLLVGVDLAILIGLLAGLLSFIPYLGTILGVILAGFAALLQFGDIAHLLAVAAVFITGQTLEGTVLSPLLVGERIGLHPVAVIFAVMAGGQLFGFVGVLLALPVAAVVAVVLRHARREYLKHHQPVPATAEVTAPPLTKSP